MISCQTITDLGVIKLMLQKYIDYQNFVDLKDGLGNGCLAYASWNENPEIIKFLIDANIPISIILDGIGEKDFIKFIPLINCPQKLNELLELGFKKYQENNFQSLHFDSFRLTPNNIHMLGHVDPFTMNFNDFVDLVNTYDQEYIFPIDFILRSRSRSDVETINNQLIHFSKNELLFEHNGMYFYADQEIVYDSILCLKSTSDIIRLDHAHDHNNSINLEGELPKKLINMYIKSMCDKKFDINCIEPEYIG
jgi:hypothetical protein